MVKAAAAEATIVDEYDLQPGELTKEKFAEQAKVKSFRSIENWVRDGLIAAKKVRRRNPQTGVVALMSIYMQDDVDKFLAEKNANHAPTGGAGQALERSEKSADMQMQALAFIANAVGGGMDPNRKPFIPIAQAAEEYDLSVPGIHHLIDDGTIKKFSGKNGKSMVSRRQIESL
jgi:hypothetical protein